MENVTFDAATECDAEQRLFLDHLKARYLAPKNPHTEPKAPKR